MKYFLAVLISLFAASANSQLISKKESTAISALLNEVSAKHKPGSYVIRNVSLLSMKDSVLEKNQDVLVQNGIIQKIGKDLNDIGNATEIDGTGKFLMPGLTDMHVHLFAKHPMKDTWTLLLLINGVTSVRDMNGEPEKLSDREKIKSNELLAPYLYQAGPIITGSKENFMVQAATPQQGREIVLNQKKSGYDFIKVHDKLDKATYEAIVDEAHKQGLNVAGHVPDKVTLADALTAGQSSIEHLTGYFEWKNNMEANLSVGSDYAQLTAKTNTWNCPTLFNHLMNISREKVLLKLHDPVSSKLIPRSLLDTWEKPVLKINKEFDALSDKNFDTLKEIVLNLYHADAKMIAGTDAGNLFFLVPGFSLHDELKLLNEIGIPVYDVLKMATVNASMALGKEKEFGTIEEGKRADLLLLNENPLENIQNLNKTQGIMIRGIWLPHQDIETISSKIEFIFSH